jgi:hypothetical protein
MTVKNAAPITAYLRPRNALLPRLFPQMHILFLKSTSFLVGAFLGIRARRPKAAATVIWQ